MKLILLFIFWSVLLNSQVFTDTILGKPKYVKEYVLFFNESGPYTLWSGDGEYGHAIVMQPKILRASMTHAWFKTHFCRYINNETFFDENRNIVKETWFYKSGKIVDDYVYTYDKLNRLITKQSKDEDSESFTRYFYRKKEKKANFKKYSYNHVSGRKENVVENLESGKELFIVRYDDLTRTDSIFVLTNDITKQTGERSYARTKDSIYHQKLSVVKRYDENYQVIEEKKFIFPSGNDNRKVYLDSHVKYEYDQFGKMIKSVNFNDGNYYNYIMNEKGKVLKEEITSGNSSVVSQKKFSYTQDGKIERIVGYYGDVIADEKRFEYDNNYISKLYYSTKFGKDNKPKETIVITFKYKFDEQKNWTEIIKNVNGKDLYKWIREIEYYK